jgi:hypothetical protein
LHKEGWNKLQLIFFYLFRNYNTNYNINQNVAAGDVEICFHAVFSPSILQNPQKDVASFSVRNRDLSGLHKMQMES